VIEADSHAITSPGQLWELVGEPLPRVLAKEVPVADIAVRQVFSHCGKAFMRGQLWEPESWPEPDAVRSPSRTIAGPAEEERRRESDVRREVEAAYRPGLYGEPAVE
jgi:hypothetical protein